MEQLCKVDVIYKEPDRKYYLLNETVSGTLLIQPTEDLQIESLGYRLVLETRGRILKKDLVINTTTLLKDTDLKAYKSYDFEFEVVNRVIEDYKGINATFSCRLEIWVLKKPSHFQQNPKGLFQKLTNKLSINNEHTYSYFLDFKAKENTKAVTSKRGELKYTFDFILPLIVFIAFPILLLIFFPNTKEMMWVKVAIGILFIGLAIGYNAVIKMVGNTHIKYSNLKDHNFSCKIENTHNWKFINTVFATYEIREEVIDDRGTSSVTYTETILNGPTKTVENPSGEIEFILPFSKKHPASFIIGNAKIYYVVVVIVKLKFGIEVSLENEFIVTRRF